MAKYAFLTAGFQVVDLPPCGCGDDLIAFSIDVEAESDQVFLVGHVACDSCGFEPHFSDSGTDAQSWREGILRVINAWSVARGGIEYPDIATFPDRLDELVDYVEGRLGPLPEYRVKVLQKHRLRRLN